MYVSRTLNGSIENFLDPSFRTVNFDDWPHVIVVSKHLGYPWPALPSEETSSDDVRQFVETNHERSEEVGKRVPRNPDLECLHTPWRNSIYRFGNHVPYLRNELPCGSALLYYPFSSTDSHETESQEEKMKPAIHV